MKMKYITMVGSVLLAAATVDADIANFAYTGAQQNWVVPVGVTSVTIEAWGAQGYSANSGAVYAGGQGGYTSGDLAVVPGQTLFIYVGGAGTVANVKDTLMGGGFNGGGDGVIWHDIDGLGGGGGGASDVRVGGISLLDRVLVAGGGGGATANGAIGGVGGGLIGGTGGGATPGEGGSQVAGGNINGAFGEGGDAIIGNTGWVGGGGGGWYGGGASPAHYGGGGGSSYIGGVNNGTMLQGVNSGDGMLRLTFEAIPEPASLGLLGLISGGIYFSRRFFRA